MLCKDTASLVENTGLMNSLHVVLLRACIRALTMLDHALLSQHFLPWLCFAAPSSRVWRSIVREARLALYRHTDRVTIPERVFFTTRKGNTDEHLGANVK